MATHEWSKKNKVYAWRPKEKKKKKPKKDLTYKRTDTKTSHVTTNKAKLPMSTLETPTKAATKPSEELLSGKVSSAEDLAFDVASTVGTLGAGLGVKAGAKAVGAGAKGMLGGSGKSLVGRWLNVDKLGKTMKLTKDQTAALAHEIGRRRIGQAADIAMNSKSKSLISKSLKIAGWTGLGLVAIKSAVESFVFAGFLKEETLQTSDFGYKNAMEHGLYDEAEAAMEMKKDLLNPEKWNSLLDSMPWLNGLPAVDRYLEISNNKLLIDEKALEIEREAFENGSSEDEKWARIKQEERDQDRAEVDYYNSERKKLVAWEAKAKADGDKKSAALWRKERALQSQKEKEDREAIAKFWSAYRKEQQKYQESLRPSKLNFGLL